MKKLRVGDSAGRRNRKSASLMAKGEPNEALRLIGKIETYRVTTWGKHVAVVSCLEGCASPERTLSGGAFRSRLPLALEEPVV